MKINFYPGSAKIGLTTTILKAFVDGVRKCGDEAIKAKTDNIPADYGVIFGFGRGNPDILPGTLQGIRYRIVKKYKKVGRNVITLDGALFQSYGALNYVRVSVGSPMRDGEFYNQNCPRDRWDMIRNDLKIDYKEWTTAGTDIIICLQPKTNWSMNGLDSLVLCSTWIEEMRKYSDRPIKVRPHPNHKLGEINKLKNQIKHFKDIEITETSRYSFIEAIQNAWATVTYNSTASVDAVANGIHSFTLSDLSMAWDVTSHDFTTIEKPVHYERDQWLNNICYAMWTLAELRDGVPWQRIKSNNLILEM